MRALSLLIVLCLFPLAGLSRAAFEGNRVKALTGALKEFADSNCDAAKISAVNDAIALFNGSFLSIKDEISQMAHADQARDALNGVPQLIVDVLLNGKGGPDCPKKIRESIKRLDALPVKPSDSSSGASNHGMEQKAN